MLKNGKTELSRAEMAQITGGLDAALCNQCCWEGTNNCSVCNGGNYCSQGELRACAAGSCDKTIQGFA